MDISQFATEMQRLIQLEREEDRQQTGNLPPGEGRAKRGVGGLSNLKLVGLENGLLDRTLLTFVNAKVCGHLEAAW